MAKVWDVKNRCFLEDDDPIMLARQAAKDKRDRDFKAACLTFQDARSEIDYLMRKQDDAVLQTWPRSSPFKGRAQEILEERRKGGYKRVDNMDVECA